MEASRKEPSQHWLLQSGDWWDITGRGSLIQDKKLTERSCMMNVGWTIQFVRKRGFKRLVWGKFTETLNNVSTSSIKFFFSCVTLQSAIFFFFFFCLNFSSLKAPSFHHFLEEPPPFGRLTAAVSEFLFLRLSVLLVAWPGANAPWTNSESVSERWPRLAFFRQLVHKCRCCCCREKDPLKEEMPGDQLFGKL